MVSFVPRVGWMAFVAHAMRTKFNILFEDFPDWETLGENWPRGVIPRPMLAFARDLLARIDERTLPIEMALAQAEIEITTLRKVLGSSADELAVLRDFIAENGSSARNLDELANAWLAKRIEVAAKAKADEIVKMQAAVAAHAQGRQP